MSKPVIAGIVFVVAAAIVLVILQFVVHLQGPITKIAVGVVVGLIAAAIAFFVVKEPAKS